MRRPLRHVPLVHAQRSRRAGIAWAATLLASSAALGLATAPAGAAAPPRGSVFGGTVTGDAPFALQLSADRRRLERALVHVKPRCQDGESIDWSGEIRFARKAPSQIVGADSVLAPNTLSRTGAISTKGLGVAGYGDQVGGITQTLKGKITGNRAKGTLQIKIALIEPVSGTQGTTCDTGVLRWTAKASRGQIFAGLTSDTRPVVLELSADRLRVAHLRVSWTAGCEGGGGWNVPDHLEGFPVSTLNKFGDTFSQGPFDMPDGGKTTFDYAVTGRIGRTTASGTYAVTVKMTDAAGAPTDTCRLPRLRWKAAS